MKILLTGGGSAGHFYPLIAIAEEIHRITDEEKLLEVDFYYMSTDPYDKKLLFDNKITFKKVMAGKMRRYFSLLNIIDVFKMALGILKAIGSVYLIYPDVVISKGGYASIPATFAARVLRIPLIIHESDSVPGRANKWASKFAYRIAVSWPEAAAAFPKDKVAVTGQPVRRDMTTPIDRGAYEFLKLEENVPTILILGGSLGSEKINQVIMDILPDLVSRYQVIHQTGAKNIEAIEKLAKVVLVKSDYKERYKPFGYLNSLALRMSAGVSTLVITRAGSTLFEIAAWGLPSILIPITNSGGDHQRKNAYSYARSGAATVIEEQNLTPHVLAAEIQRIIEDKGLQRKMHDAALRFYDGGGAEKIAQEAIKIGLEHEE